MKFKLGIIGSGNIGTALYLFAKTSGYDVTICDVKPPVDNIFDTDWSKVDVMNDAELTAFVQRTQAIAVAGPFFINKTVAKKCAELNVAYFDFTEDVHVTDYIKEVSKNSTVPFVPQCGLAPGAINIIASDLVSNFDEVDELKLRVGALTKSPSNNMKYCLSWSTDGLVNEYANDCEIIQNNKRMWVKGLDGYETIVINGQEYEAFYTSGGVGTLCQTYEGKIKNLNYKTLRYPGHHQYMKFLFEDLDFANNRDELVRILNRSVPKSYNDTIIMQVTAIGKIGGIKVEENNTQVIDHNNQLTAIQRSTAIGMFAVIEMYKNNQLAKNGFVRQEDIVYSEWRKYTKNIYS